MQVPANSNRAAPPRPQLPIPDPRYIMMAAHQMHGVGRLVKDNDNNIEAAVKALPNAN